MITPAVTAVRAGEELAFIITNVGPGTFDVFRAAALQPGPLDNGLRAVRSGGSASGASAPRAITVPPGLAPGQYRLSQEVSVPGL